MEMLKACGGCKKCYGKGYGTQTRFARGSDDWNGTEYEWKLPTIVFCKCARGKQLEHVFVEILASAETMKTAREVRHLLKAYLLNK